MTGEMRRTGVVITVGVLSAVALATAAARPAVQRRGRGGRGRGEGGAAAVKHEVRNAARRLAVCNDGSPAVFYFHRGDDPDQRKWINNLDRIAARLSWAQVKGLADSGWVPDVKPFGQGTMDVRPDDAAAFEYVSARPDESCVAANPQQPGKCLRESFAFPYITTPMFVYADQRDSLHLGTLGVGAGRQSPRERMYVEDYARRLRESLGPIPAAFSPSIGYHTSLGNERYRGAIIDGVPLADAIARWYSGREDHVKLIAPYDAGSGRGRGRRGGG